MNGALHFEHLVWREGGDVMLEKALVDGQDIIEIRHGSPGYAITFGERHLDIYSSDGSRDWSNRKRCSLGDHLVTGEDHYRTRANGRR